MTKGNANGSFFASGTAIVGLTLITLCFVGVACSLAAEAVPDLKGTWQGKTQTVAIGKLGHTEHSAKPKFTSVEFTIRIDAQEGMVFHGIKESKKAKEQVLGVIKADNKSVWMADTDGYYMGTLLSADEMELVYLEAGTKSGVASYTVYKRVK